MRSRFRIAHAAVLLATLGACATHAPRGDAVARLQSERDRQPRTAGVHRALGIALYKAGRLSEARAALGEATRLDPRDGTTALYAGLAAEQQQDFAAARTAYTTYLQHGRTKPIRAQLQARLAALQRREIEAAARAAVANEASIGRSPGNPRVVAVMPFRFAGADQSLKALERGFQELVTTDLARSSQLTVVERARMQAVLDELALQRGSASDTAHRVRAGRLLRAGRIVQGAMLQVGRNQLRVDAAVVDVPTTQAIGGASGNESLDALFELEKRIVLALFSELGVSLTAAERNAIEQRPTRSIAAFLAYSRGLLAEDAGDFSAASRHYNDAFRIDPRFDAAQQRSDRTAGISAAQQATPTMVEAQTAGTVEGQIATAAVQGSVSNGTSTGTATVTNVVNGLNPTQAGVATATTTLTGGTLLPGRDPAAESTGNDDPTNRTAKIIIVVPIPGVLQVNP